MLGYKTGDQQALIAIAEKAYLVALEFERRVSKEWIAAYLNDNLAIDALAELSLTANILHKQKPYIFSVSHKDWLSKLRLAKLSIKTFVTTVHPTVSELYNTFLDIQQMCMMFPNLKNLVKN